MPKLLACRACCRDMPGAAVVARLGPTCGARVPARGAAGGLSPPGGGSPGGAVLSDVRGAVAAAECGGVFDPAGGELAAVPGVPGAAGRAGGEADGRVAAGGVVADHPGVRERALEPGVAVRARAGDAAERR